MHRPAGQRLHVVLSLLAVTAILLLAPPAEAEDGVDLRDADAVKKALGDPEAGVRLAAARAAATLQDSLLVTPLVRLLKDDEREVRHAAVAALAARTSPKDKKKAALGLAGRLPSYAPEDADVEEHLLLVQALHDLAQPATIKALLDVSVNTDKKIVRARARAVANVPAKEAIERLIQFGSRGRRGGSGWRDVARDALQYATGVRLKNEPDAWRQWWRDAEEYFDFEAAAKLRAEEREMEAAKKRRREEQERKRRERRDRKPEEQNDEA